MKKIKLIALMALLSAPAFAQDLIVTIANDSLNCKITKVDESFIQFAYLKDGIVRKSLISQESVASYQITHFDTPAIPLTKAQSAGINEEIKWQTALRGGYSWRTVNISNEPEMKSLKHGFHLGTDFFYFFNNYIGLGGTVCYYHNKLNYSYYRQNGVFAAPNLALRLSDADNKNTFTTNYALGYFGLGESDSHQRDFSGTFSYLISIGYERGVDKNLAIGGKVALLVANIYSTEVNASRLDLSIYVAFNTNKK